MYKLFVNIIEYKMWFILLQKVKVVLPIQGTLSNFDTDNLPIWLNSLVILKEITTKIFEWTRGIVM